MKKRILSVFLSLCMAVGMLAAVPAARAEGTGMEAESNDSLASANGVAVNAQVAGSLSKSSDEDWYQFDVPGDGHISLTFEHGYVDSSSNYWRTALYTSANAELRAWEWEGNATTAGTTTKTGVPAGTYYLRVSRANYNHSAEEYRFTVNFTQSDTWEKEFNETIVTANAISTDTEYSGTIRASSDEDWYQFELPRDGAVSLTFGHDFVDSGNDYWRTALYTSGNKEINAWKWAGNATTAGTTTSTGLPAGTYYLCVTNANYNVSSKTYRFTVNYTQSDAWEKEFNETIVTANAISTDTEYSGTIRSSSDEDWYEFELPEAGMISLSFGHDFVDSGNDYWRTALYTSANKEMDAWKWKGNDTSSSDTNKIGVSAGTYYICVTNANYNVSSKTYRFTVNYSRGGGTGEEPGGEPQEPIAVTGITLNRGTLTLTEGGTFQLAATVTPADATDKSVTWRSANPSVAAVSDNGRVTAVSAGSARVTASSGGLMASCTVTVTAGEVEATGLTLNRSTLTLTEGGTAQLTATVTPANATNATVTWRSGDTSVVTVSNGRLTAVGAGSAKITATCGELTASCTVTVTAGQAQPTGVHFERVDTYFQDQFTDVPANQWYTDSVAEAFELGLMKGNSDTTFNPYGDVTIAEAITMAARVHSIYTYGRENFTPTGDKWYQGYLDYAYENGIIGLAYYNCDVTHRATRAQFAEIFAKSLPAEGLAPINNVPDGAIPDVSMDNRYADSVYTLYRAGILAGSDANGTFAPQTYITRAQSAAIVSRLAESNNRLTINLG